MFLADSRDALIRDKRPAFTTVLDVDAPVDNSFTAEQLRDLKFRGAFYVDFDGPLTQTIERAQEFAARLKELDVDLDAVRWFATGGRGFHCEVPMPIFVERPPVKGFANLPAIYKEMLFNCYVDTADLRVYSARRGRMWRTPGVQRENGLYKVPITAAELHTLTAESYLEICAAPRAVTVAAPTIAHGFAVLFAKAQAKVDGAIKNRKASGGDAKILAKFKGKFPTSLENIMQGAPTNPDAGYHAIALQVAITAAALNKKDDEVIAACEGLFENHQSTGYRYNTPAKREEEMLRLLRYTSGNPCYEFSRSAVKSICARDTDTDDLSGADDATGALTESSSEADHGLLGSVEMRENGIYCKDAEGIIKAISNLSFSNVTVLKLLPDGAAPPEIYGFDCQVRVKSKDLGTKLIDIDTFSTKAKFNSFAMKQGAVMSGSDNQTAAITQLLHSVAEKNKKIKYVVGREGLDIIRNPDTGSIDLIYVGAGKVAWARNEDGEPPYVYNGPNGPAGIFRSTLLDEQMLTGTDEELQVIRAMLRMNDPKQLFYLIGWLVACYHRRIISSIQKEFPLLQVYGQAGAGKTQTMMALARMHYGEFDLVSPIGADQGTAFGIEQQVVSSSSMPVIIDEYKPRWIKPAVLSSIRTLFNAVWNDLASTRGGGDSTGGAKDYRKLTRAVMASPIAYIGEALEATTSFVERSVIVSLSKVGIYGRQKEFDLVQDNPGVLSRLGRTILSKALLEPTEKNFIHFRNTRLRPAMEKAWEIRGKGAVKRSVYGTSVAIVGFEYFAEAVRLVWPTELDEDLENVRMAGMASQIGKDTENQGRAEASKVMDVLSFITRTEEGFSQHKLAEGKHYAFVMQGGVACVDLKMQEAYYKYTAWSKQKGQEILYDNYESFMAGLSHYRPCINQMPTDSPIADAGTREPIYRFALTGLEEEGVSQFKGQI